MMGSRVLLVPLLLATAIGAQNEGRPMPEVELSGLANTQARSVEDFAGRTVLIEMFAYW
jgi:hypothetical protein